MTDKLLDFEIVDLAELKDDGSDGFGIAAAEVPPNGGCGGWFGNCSGDGGCGGSFGNCS